MADRMRAFDWSSTDLGPPGKWPKDLQAAVGICLMSRFPMKVWWGPRLTVFYNDAYRPFLGKAKHPAALGRSAWEAWPEIWDILGPMTERALTTGEASWSEDILLIIDRELPREEVYLTFSISPIPGQGEGDQVGGVFSAIMETTEKLVGARRLDTLRELGIRAAQAQSVTDTCRRCAEALGGNPRDLPFAAIYTLDKDGTTARLAASLGLQPDGWRPPALLSTQGVWPAPWPPLLSVLKDRCARDVDDLGAEGGDLPREPWSEPVRRAVILPIGAGAADHLAGVLVAGVSPRRPLDNAYRDFFALVAGHIGSAMADSRAFEAERGRAEALAELDRAKTAFFTNVSHEFRTPLTLMLGPLEDELRANPNSHPHLEVAHRNCLRLLKLVNTLLDFSRIEAGRCQAEYRATDLAGYTAELASLFRSAVEKAGLRLEVRCPPLPFAMFVDRDMWEKILLNLLGNALKHTFQGAIEVSLAPGPCLSSGVPCARLCVQDTGVGIAQEELPHVFERFYRARAARSRTHEGAGIGLALVKELVKLHGGDIAVESAEGGGTRFTVQIPAGAAHLPPEQIGPGSASPPGLAAAAAAFVNETQQWLPEPATVRGSSPPQAQGEDRPRVLLADDNADMREYLRRLLEVDYEVVATPDGEAALAAAQERRPDLVLTDVMMPRLDGFGLLGRLRSDPRTRTLPIILISARAGEEAQVEGVARGADDYLVKPFTARELLARVATHLALARARGEMEAELSRSRQEVEDRVAERTLELRESEARLQGFIRHSIAAIAFKGLDGRYLLINPRMEAALGRPSREILGRTNEDLFTLEVCARARERDQRVLGLRQDVQEEEQWIHGDGSTRHYLVTEFLLEDALGQAWGLGVLAHDITECKRADQAMLQSQKLESLGVLAGGIAHDFNNLLGAMQGNVDLAMTESSLDQALPYLETLRGLMAKGSGLLRQLLAYSGRGKSSVRPLDLNQLVEEMTHLLGTSISKKATMRLNLHPHLPLMEADPAQIQQVVMNLVINASEAMGEQNGVITLSTRLEEVGPTAPDSIQEDQPIRPGPHVALEVSDNGCGMAPEVLKQIFDPFFTTKFTGRGLGLSAIHGIVRGYRGSIQVSSEPGRGSTFKLLFPAAQGQAVPEPTDPPLPRHATGKEGGGGTVLVVDDEAEMRSVLAAALGRVGIGVLQARDGMEALSLFREHRERIRLILMDLTMPNMDGEEACRELRRMGASVPIILSSGFSETEAQHRFDDLGLAGFLQKPFALGTLIEMSRKLLAGQ
jgi:PAS domain S-box-containing protein